MSTSKKPTVLIVGAGIGGLMLGALLEKSNTPYMIFERSTSFKQLGSAMCVGPTLIPIFQQLGIYEEFLTIGKYMTQIDNFKESLETYPPNDHRRIEEFSGYGKYMVSRPKLHDLILRQVPINKIHFGRRVLNISETEDRVLVHLSDNSVYEGDIIVGADGAYSEVRQRMYEQLKAKGELPKSDQEDLPFSCICLVGQTKPLDPEQYPIVNQPRCAFQLYLGDNKPYSWILVTTAQNTIAFMVLHHLNSTTNRATADQCSRQKENVEWDAYPAQAMCDETRDFPISLQEGKKHTLGDLFEQTPKELISKVMLEEKVFQTWYSGRYVLLGDACHKLHPAGGHGAVTAFHDAVALANLLYAMPTTTAKDITTVFKEYYMERLPAVTESFNQSHRLSKMTDKGILGTIILFTITRLPDWLMKIMLAKTVRFRPQVGFLEPIKIMGSVIPVPSPSELKARALFDKQNQTK
ncbi:hypothetical protein FBU30_007521 [Linnemannia zychae]|nr:hypothetical protein FBU30_007521 [Linnemannia zychae]